MLSPFAYVGMKRNKILLVMRQQVVFRTIVAVVFGVLSNNTVLVGNNKTSDSPKMVSVFGYLRSSDVLPENMGPMMSSILPCLAVCIEFFC